MTSRISSGSIRGERGRADEVGEHHRDLTALGGSVGCRKIVGGRCFRARVSAQGGDGVEQLTAVPDNIDTKILQILRRQARQDRVVDLVLAECGLIPLETKAPQSSRKVHCGAIALLQPMILQPKRRVQSVSATLRLMNCGFESCFAVLLC